MKIINILFKVLISILLILLIVYANLIASSETTGENIITIYYIVSAIVIFIIIYSIIKNIRTYAFLIILIFWIFFNRIPAINQVFDKDICLDSAICKEGLEVNTEYGLIKISEESCIKYNWQWNAKSKKCNMR